MKAKYTIGYIDEDPKEVNTYARRLRPYGFNVRGFDFEQGMTFSELMTQVYDANDIDLLMIDFNLNGMILAAPVCRSWGGFLFRRTSRAKESIKNTAYFYSFRRRECFFDRRRIKVQVATPQII